jgi:hypothetical protein
VAQIEIHIDLDVASEPISGRLRAGRGAPVTFVGWIELVQSIEQIRSAPRLLPTSSACAARGARGRCAKSGGDPRREIPFPG